MQSLCKEITWLRKNSRASGTERLGLWRIKLSNRKLKQEAFQKMKGNVAKVDKQQSIILKILKHATMCELI